MRPILRHGLGLLLASAALLAPGSAGATISFVDYVAVPGGATDLSGQPSAFGGNRLSFGSDLYYDASTRSFWGITDRGPGGGVIDFAPRMQNFSLNLSSTGKIGSFELKSSNLFRQDGQTFSGLNPGLLNGDSSILGKSFDSEGISRLKNGNFLVSDEYGPSIYEFTGDGNFVRAYKTPDNLLPRTANGTLNYVDGRGVITKGRQDNRGFEGVTVSADGKTAYAVLQDPLVNEGAQSDGRRSQNVRIVAFDTATGESTGQFIYQLESLSDINERVPDDTFGNTAQGRNIGLSAVVALPNGKLLVLERDNRGFGVDDATAERDVASKRVYLVDLKGATDVSNLDLTGTSVLPAGVVPVGKSLWLDIAAELSAAGIPVAEKIEGISFGPAIDGGYSFVAVTDNDFSVTQTGSGEQFDRCTSGFGGSFLDVALGSACPEGMSLIPSYAYVFQVSGDSLSVAGIPEPSSWAMLIAGFGLIGVAQRRRRFVQA